VDIATYVSRHHGLLGTVIELRIEAADEIVANQIEAIVVAEVERLQSIFSVYDEGSELRKWQRGEIEPGPELLEVLRRAFEWQRMSGGGVQPGSWGSQPAVGRRSG
jgi:thiamine biosynthesis lipoprotein ApbE